ncbi:MAG TPA: hypothetical protein VK714_01960 [Myxococcota bacterium]|nr:hypothetical protein [Myxococcota bacterium]
MDRKRMIFWGVLAVAALAVFYVVMADRRYLLCLAGRGYACEAVQPFWRR